MNVEQDNYDIPAPENLFGYYWAQLEDFFTKKELKEFGEWISGQTIVSDEYGRAIYYTEDVIRFLRMTRDGIPTYLD